MSFGSEASPPPTSPQPPLRHRFRFREFHDGSPLGPFKKQAVFLPFLKMRIQKVGEVMNPLDLVFGALYETE